MSRYITRQEIAVMVEVTEDVVRRSEQRFGILPHRQKLSRRCVRYLRAPSIAALKKRGLIG